MRMLSALLATTLLLSTSKAEDLRMLQEKARAALKAGNAKEAVTIADQIAKAEPKSAEAQFFVAMVYSQAREHAAAIRAFDAVVALEPDAVVAIDRRGDSKLKTGDFAGAIKDFDTFLKNHPDQAPQHWRRGIALYYAGRFADGVKQFDIHRTVNPEDVENSAWHYLCNVKANGKAQAVKDLIPVSQDARVPMAQVLELFAGKLKPEDVIAAAEKSGLTGNRLESARFYAHLYVALYYDGENNAAKVKEHLTEAVKHVIPDYMWDVAKVHLKTIEKK